MLEQEVHNDVGFILQYAQTNFAHIGIAESDIITLNNKIWIELLSKYVWTRGYAKKYYLIIFTAIKDGIIDKINPMKVLSGELEEEYEKVRLNNINK